MRVGIIGLLQESNTFLPARTTWDEFEADTIAVGNEVRTRFEHASHEIAGFIAGLAEESIECAPLFAARALPYGTIEADCFERLIEVMLNAVRQAGPLDGILVAPHGATVSEAAADADGTWLSRLRQLVGPRTPIVGTLDPHANLSPAMVEACDALTAYRTNPHVDQLARGHEAARLIARVLREGVRPTMAAAYPPLAISIESQCTDEGPCRELCAVAENLRAAPEVLSASVLLGFPYADVPEMGSAALVVTDNDAPAATRLARQLADAMWHRRRQLVQPAASVPDALAKASGSAAPVCLLDMGDNVGGGSPGDGTWLARELHRQSIARSLVVLFDPDAVAAAAEAGIGGRRELAIGGRGGLPGEVPLQAEFTVTSLHEGRFTETAPLHGGFTSFDQGHTAVLTTDADLTVVATSRRMVPFSLAQLTSCDLDPTRFRILVAKGVNAPMAAYRPVCQTFIRVNTPGFTCADMTSLAYAHRRRPLFPFESDAKYPAS